MATALKAVYLCDYNDFVPTMLPIIEDIAKSLKEDKTVPLAILCSWKNTTVGADKVYWYYQSHEGDVQFIESFHRAMSKCGLKLLKGRVTLDPTPKCGIPR